MKFARESLRLYGVTDRSWLENRKLCEDVEAAIRGGATLIQLREKELSFEVFLEEAREVQAVCKRYHVPFLINDSVEIALASGADGIHVGQSDMDALHVRAQLGADKIIGVSAQTVEQALLAEKSGADYLGVGAVFTTSTKKDADFVPYETLKAICEAVQIPVCAIGGIYDHNIGLLRGSGIEGVALVSAIFAARDIEAECKKLYNLSKEMVEG